MKYGDSKYIHNGKNIVVEVVPSCTSANREYQYIWEVWRSYSNGKLPKNATIAKETETEVIIEYRR